MYENQKSDFEERSADFSDDVISSLEDFDNDSIDLNDFEDDSIDFEDLPYEKMIKEKDFLEYDFHHDHYYGTSKKILNENIKKGKK